MSTRRVRDWAEHVDFPAKISVAKDVHQFRVNDLTEFKFHLYNNSQYGVYASVHDLESRARGVFNKAFFDIDHKDMRKSFDDTYTFVETLESYHVKPRVYFSGSKGFHVYIDFPDTKIPEFSARIDKFMDMVTYSTGISTFDKAVCKDINRIARVPHTVNTKSGKICVPIDIYRSDVDDYTVIPVKKHPSKKFASSLLKLDLPKTEVETREWRDFGPQLDYVMSNAHRIVDGRKNLIWKFLIPAMYHSQYPPDRILKGIEEFCLTSGEGWNSQLKKFAEYHLKRTIEHGWFPTSLEVLRRDYGFTINEKV